MCPRCFVSLDASSSCILGPSVRAHTAHAERLHVAPKGVHLSVHDLSPTFQEGPFKATRGG